MFVLILELLLEMFRVSENLGKLQYGKHLGEKLRKGITAQNIRLEWSLFEPEHEIMVLVAWTTSEV